MPLHPKIAAMVANPTGITPGMSPADPRVGIVRDQPKETVEIYRGVRIVRSSTGGYTTREMFSGDRYASRRRRRMSPLFDSTLPGIRSQIDRAIGRGESGIGAPPDESTYGPVVFLGLIALSIWAFKRARIFMFLVGLLLLSGCGREGYNVGPWPLIEIDPVHDPRPYLDTSQPPTSNEQLLMTYIRRLELAVQAYNESAETHNASVEELLP